MAAEANCREARAPDMRIFPEGVHAYDLPLGVNDGTSAASVSHRCIVLDVVPLVETPLLAEIRSQGRDDPLRRGPRQTFRVPHDDDLLANLRSCRVYPQVRHRLTFGQLGLTHGDVLLLVLGKGAFHRITLTGTGDYLRPYHLVALQTLGSQDMMVGDKVPRRRDEKPGGKAACLVSFVCLMKTTEALTLETSSGTDGSAVRLSP